MNIQEILKKPDVINNTHESCYRTYSILDAVIEMLNRGDSKETIFDMINYLSGKQIAVNKP